MNQQNRLDQTQSLSLFTILPEWRILDESSRVYDDDVTRGAQLGHGRHDEGQGLKVESTGTINDNRSHPTGPRLPTAHALAFHNVMKTRLLRGK